MKITKQDLVEQLAEAVSTIEQSIWLLNDDDIKNANKLLDAGMITAARAAQKMKLLANNQRGKYVR
ncbi:hypothetical protein P9057_06760 [Gallibacterium anatis]|uniref:hypothetical protein n=1 Tax=Gallibacterium anatis TaxID=750 RepID=UPI0005311602|nr:hypothetical protein [Gallibacterium anatis]KGQ36103.1 hypothetical protein JP34_01040 [Gallibacterium anatis]